MKLRWLAIAAALAAFSAGPWTLAQVSDQDKDQPKSGDVQNAPKQKPAALPTADDGDIKHDGGKTDKHGDSEGADELVDVHGTSS